MPFYAGLDLGQAADYTALVLLDQLQPAPVAQMQQAVRGDERMRYTRQEPVTAPPQPARYECRHIERFRLGTPYPQIVQAVNARLSLPLLHDAVLVVDGTGVGRPVVDMFRAAGRKLIPVMITAGNQVTRDEAGYLHVPKRELVAIVQVLLQSERLKIAQGLPEAAALVQELISFQVKITTSANDIYGEWRSGQHDDLVLALAMAAFIAERQSRPAAPPAQSHSFQSLAWNPNV